MYTSRMQKSSSRWWDWTSVTLLFLLVETSASRLVSTSWTEYLYLGQTAAYIAFTVGAALGYSRFSKRASRWISFLYMLLYLPLLWTLLIDQKASLEEQFLSVGGRLYLAFADFFARRPVEDPIFFISLITLGFWVIGASAAFQLVRRQNFLTAVLPSAVALLVIQGYDNFLAWRVWMIAFFFLLALLLLGRLNFLANRESWRERRIFLSPDTAVDLSGIMTVAAALILFISWTPPASLAGLDSASRTWNRITQPWRDLTERLENAVEALESSVGGESGDFYGTEIALGRGLPLSDTVMFRVQIPNLPSEQTPPRYYWRGYTYDYFTNGQWYTTDSLLVDYSPEDALLVPLPFVAPEPARFLFQTGDQTFSLLYAPSQAVRLSRPASLRVRPAGGRAEILGWYASPALRGGEAYQVDAVLINPNTRQLREAGHSYPAWVTEKYLQLPSDFSPRIAALAVEIAANADTPYDAAVAITRYLRDNIEYVETLPAPPRNRDPLEWMLFENRQAYCVYYASAEVLMLRSLGIPARLAVGFAQGEGKFSEETGAEYIVRKKDAHAWPEVYFPGFGWVEFEPTASQPVLSRPLPPPDPDELGAPIRNLPQLDEEGNPRDNLRGLQEEEDVAVPEPTANAPTAVNPRLYLLLFLFAFASLTMYLSRRYAVPQRVPVLLRTAYERNGVSAPAWVIHWERWVTASPIARAFESVNFSLRLLDKPMPMDATPLERAARLTRLLPSAQNEILALLDEHQTSLYTSRTANVLRAQRFALRLRWRAVLERIRYFFEGKPIESP